VSDLQRVSLTGSRTSDYNAKFWEIINTEFPELEGRQEPEVRICWQGGDFTHGDKAIKLAARFGIKLMPWQADEVRLALATGQDGRWLHSDVVLLCPRQNGKSLILEVIILYRLFVLNHQIVFSAHQWRTAKSIRNRLWKKIKSRQWALRRLTRNTASAGEAEMETAEGGKIQFTTRSNDMGRGFDKIDLLMVDEAYNLDSGEMDAVAPTQLASDDPQTYFTSSAVNQLKHFKGEELSRIRHRALSGEDETMLYSEYRVPDGMDIDDALAWKMANPSYGVVATEKKIRSMRNKLSDDGFWVEMLGVGDWFDLFSSNSDFTSLVDLEAWTLAKSSPSAPGDSCVGVEVSVDGSEVAFVAAVLDGERVFLSLSPMTEFDRGETIDALKRAVDVNDPLGAVLDPIGPASTLVPLMEDAGIEPTKLSGSKSSAAFELFMRMWAEGRIVHDGDPRWLSAWEVAEEKTSKYRSLQRRTEVTVLFAAFYAVWGLQELRIPVEVPEVKTKRRFVGHAEPVVVRRDVAEMAF